jgi:hypothetical protein
LFYELQEAALAYDYEVSKAGGDNRRLGDWEIGRLAD